MKLKIFVVLVALSFWTKTSFAQEDVQSVTQVDTLDMCEVDSEFCLDDNFDIPELGISLDQLENAESKEEKMKIASIAKLAALRIKLHVGKHKVAYLVTTGAGAIVLAGFLANHYWPSKKA